MTIANTVQNTQLSRLVDTLGALNAKIGALEAEAKEIKEILKQPGNLGTTINGKKYRATVYEQERSTPDMEAITALYDKLNLGAVPKNYNTAVILKLTSLKG